MARVVVLGSSNTDLCVRLPKLPARGETVLGGPFWSGPGGKGANQAVAARRAGADVVFLTAVGDDTFGHDSLARYRAEGIDVAHARVLPCVASGVALIFIGEQGENVIGVAPGANQQLTVADIDALPDSVFEPPGVLLVSLEVAWETVVHALARAHRAGLATILNPAPVDVQLADEGVLRLVTVLTPNESEAFALARSEMGRTDTELLAAVRHLRQTQGAGQVLVTRGAAGCLLVSDDSALTFPAHAVEAVDTVGAGDAFNGALAAALAEGLPLVDAVQWASAAGALAVTRSGAQAASPTREAIMRLASSVVRCPLSVDRFR